MYPFTFICSRDAGDRSRDRERQRQARAQMSSQVAEPEEFMPVFDAPVRVILIYCCVASYNSLLFTTATGHYATVTSGYHLVLKNHTTQSLRKT